MNNKGFKRFRQIMAIIGIILLLSIYIVAIIAAATDYEYSKAVFMLAIYGSFVIPVLIYIIQLLYKMGHKDD